MDNDKLKYDILGMSETHLSSDTEMLHHVPSFNLFTNNRSTFCGGVLLYVRDTFNANVLVNFSVMLEHLKTIFVFISVGEINYVLGNVYRSPHSSIDEFISEFSNILNNALSEFPNSSFYIMGDFNYDLFSINPNKRCMEFYLLFTSLGFFPNENETN